MFQSGGGGGTTALASSENSSKENTNKESPSRLVTYIYNSGQGFNTWLTSCIQFINILQCYLVCKI